MGWRTLPTRSSACFEARTSASSWCEARWLRELAKNGNARLYLSFDRNGLRLNATLGEHDDSSPARSANRA
jgi:hypothetical protein